MTQKTWTDLLGPFDERRSERQGRYIVRMTGPASWRVLWSFQSEANAIACFQAWQLEADPARSIHYEDF